MVVGQNIGEGRRYWSEAPVCMAACLVIAAPSIVSLFNGVVRSFVRLPYRLDTLFIYGVFALIFLLAFKKLLSRCSATVCMVIPLLIIAYLRAFLSASEYSGYFLSIGFGFLLRSAPWLVVTYAVRDYALLKRYLYLSAIVMLVAFFANRFVFGAEVYGSVSYSQHLGYWLLPVAVIFADAALGRQRMRDFMLFGVAMVFLLSTGARGPLASIALYLLLRYWSNAALSARRGVLIAAGLAAFIILVYPYYDGLLEWLPGLFEDLGWSTRSVTRLLEGSFFHDDARSRLTSYSINLIKNHPILGVGVGNDRLLLSREMLGQDAVEAAVGWYPHNIFLEILLHFGLLLGAAASVILARIIIVPLRRSPREEREVICIFLAIGFCPLLFSGSYITSPEFFALLGFCLYQSRNAKIGVAGRPVIGRRDRGVAAPLGEVGA